MAVIGIEEHWVTAELTRALEGVPERQRDDSLALNHMGDNQQRLEDLTDLRIATMDEAGIDLQVLSLAPPATQGLPAAEARPLSRHANDVAAETVRAHPGRFRAMATLPMADPAAAAAELERAADDGFVGTMVYGRTGDVPLDDPRYDDVLAVAAARGLPVFIHPQIPPRAIRDAAYGGFDPLVELGLATFGWGWHLEAATAALRLIVRGTFDRHPDLKIVLGHWGELLPFWLDRADSLSGVAHLDRRVSEVVRSNVYLTASGMLNPALLQHALAVTSVDHLLFSTDYPFQRPTRSDIDGFVAHLDRPEDRERFLSGTARALFGIPETATGTER